MVANVLLGIPDSFAAIVKESHVLIHSPVSELTRGRSNCILRPPFPVTQKMNSILNYEQCKLILRDLHIDIQG